MATGYETVVETIQANGAGTVQVDAPSGKIVVNVAIELTSPFGSKVMFDAGGGGPTSGLVLDANSRVTGVTFNRRSTDYQAYLFCVDT